MALGEYKSEQEAPSDEIDDLNSIGGSDLMAEPMTEEQLDEQGLTHESTFNIQPFDQDGNPVWSEHE